MFQRFFVPLDGSTRAEKAIPFAARLAHEVSGTVTLARVIVPPMGTEEYGANILANETRLVQAKVMAEAKEYLDEVLERYDQELDGIHLVLETVPGTVPSTLFELSSQEHSDLMVMCSRGDNWLKRWIFGSVAQATFRQSHLPILVLNDHGNAFTLEDRPLRILVPLDGSELSEAVLEPVFQLLSIVSASAPHKVHLLQIVATPPATGRFRSDAHITDALQKEECQKLAQLMRVSSATGGTDKTVPSIPAYSYPLPHDPGTHTLPDGVNQPDDFMTRDTGVGNREKTAFFHETITVANSTGFYFEAHLACFRLR